MTPDPTLLAAVSTGEQVTFWVLAPLCAIAAVAMVLLSLATTFAMYMVAVAVSGVGFGLYFAVDLALVTEVLPDPDNAAKDLGVFNYAGALPFTIAPALARSTLKESVG